jgi:light-regulated signal transduction histidine kinase (bacteriophytochrome)
VSPAPGFEEVFAAMAAASAGDLAARVPLPEVPDLNDPPTRFAVELNVLLDDMAYRYNELKASHLKLEDSNRDLRDFVFIASHDLQEPLRKIQSFGSLLEAECAAGLGAEGRDYVARMRGAAGRMRTLIDNLLSLARVTTKAHPFRPLELDAVLRQVLADLGPRIRECGAEIALEPLPALHGDASQLGQLFQNLLGNALKYRRPGETPRIRVALEKGAPSGFCAVRVEDNGIGFEEAHAEKIFKPFERLHGSGLYEGTGIGLAIVRKVAERHGGEVRAQGTPGRGSAFTVILPLRHRR